MVISVVGFMDSRLKQYLQPSAKNIIIIYTLYLCSVVLPVFMVIGAVMAYINRNVNNVFLASHYVFLVRTCVIYMFIVGAAFVVSFASVGIITNILLYLWFIVRIVNGLRYLFDGLPHQNPLTFWVK